MKAKVLSRTVCQQIYPQVAKPYFIVETFQTRTGPRESTRVFRFRYSESAIKAMRALNKRDLVEQIDSQNWADTGFKIGDKVKIKFPKDFTVTAVTPKDKSE